MPYINLDNTLRLQVIARMGLPTIDNSPFYHSTGTPYYFVDEAIKEAAQSIIGEITTKGAAEALLETSSTYTWPASTTTVAWSTINTALSSDNFTLPGAELRRIKDITVTDQPIFIRILPANREDQYNRLGVFYVPRQATFDRRFGDSVAMLSGDSLSLYGKCSTTRSLQFEFVPYYDKAGTKIPLPTEATFPLVNLAAINLLRTHNMDVAGLEATYLQSVAGVINTLKSGRGLIWRQRSRYKGL